MSSTDELTRRARFLYHAAPREFQEFFAAFVNYTDQQYEVLVMVTDKWQQAQGHAQQCKKIVGILEEAKKQQ